MKCFILVVFLMISLFGYSQNHSKGYNKLLNSAIDKLDIGDVYGANKIFTQLYQQDSLDQHLNFYAGVSCFELKQYKRANTHFSKTSSTVSLELYRYKASIAHIDQKI